MASRRARTCPDCYGTGNVSRETSPWGEFDCDTCDGAGLVDLTPNPAALQARALEQRVLARRHREA